MPSPVFSSPSVPVMATPIVAVSPFIGGKAVKGPAAKIFDELGLDTSPAGLIASYDGLLTGLVVDRQDASETLPVAVHATDTLMRDSADQDRLARETIEFALRSAA